MKTAKIIWLVVLGVLTFSTGAAMETSARYEKATFAGGCFWCMEHPFEKIDGVVEVLSGYTGGQEANPTYRDVSSGATGHFEAVMITYDPSVVSYEQLLDVFWMQIDPTDAGGQFVDRGSQYRTAVFYHNEAQRELAELSRKKLAESGRYQTAIVTPVVKASAFYAAEEYHQDYYLKSPARYKAYRDHSGRDLYLSKIWDGKSHKDHRGSEVIPGDEELKKMLTPLQYHVTRKNGTEKPFENDFWDNKRPGIYVDLISGRPLFSSRDKFDSKTGWPSFTKPLVPENIVEVPDGSFFMVRTEVRSRFSDSHLGHVFDDGPPPTGLRYCINSAALRFIPLEECESQGYGEFVPSVK